MKIIAIPTINGELSSHFGGSEYFSVFETEGGKIINELILPTPEHNPGAYPKYLADNKVTDVILGGVGQRAIDIFTHHKITVHTGVAVNKTRILAEELLKNTLKVSDNSCDSEHHEHGEHDGEGHHHGHGGGHGCH